MNYLAIDTSSKHLLIILKRDDEIYCVYEENCMADHSTKLMVKVDEILKKAKSTLFDMDFFAVVVGPGSFTGIRIGVATVKAFSLAVNKPVLPITSFDTITYNKGIGKFLSIIDAKHDNFYVQGVKDLEVEFTEFVNIDKLKELIKVYKPISFEELTIESERVKIYNGLIKAIELKRKNITFDLDNVKPLYLRKSQAEENR